jgi:hypothetical protein
MDLMTWAFSMDWMTPARGQEEVQPHKSRETDRDDALGTPSQSIAVRTNMAKHRTTMPLAGIGPGERDEPCLRELSCLTTRARQFDTAAKVHPRR